MADQKISQMDSVVSLTGAELIPVVQGGANRKATPSQLRSYAKKDYRVILSQSGTDAPVATVLQDDLAVPVWSYSAVGIYLLTKAGAFTVNKTLPSNVVGYNDPEGNLFTLERTSADVMTLKTYAAADTTVLANGVLTGQEIYIEIYN
jgi:hypothetical protein